MSNLTHFCMAALFLTSSILYVVDSEEGWQLNVDSYIDVAHWMSGFGLCKELAYLTYDHGFSGKVWQGVSGYVYTHDGKAKFAGVGTLYLPLFACNDLLPRYSMRFLISPDRAFNDMAVLGNSLDPSKSSLLVHINNGYVYLTIKPRADKWDGVCPGHWVPWYPHSDHKTDHGSFGHHDAIVTIFLPLQEFSENVVTVIQERGYIYLQVNDQNALATGNLPTVTDEPLYIGAGADPISHRVLPLYRGTFDKFVFEKCPSTLVIAPPPPY